MLTAWSALILTTNPWKSAQPFHFLDFAAQFLQKIKKIGVTDHLGPNGAHQGLSY